MGRGFNCPSTTSLSGNLIFVAVCAVLSRLGEGCALRDAWHPAWAGRLAGLQAQLTGRRPRLCVGTAREPEAGAGRPLTAARVAEGRAELDRLLSSCVSLTAFFQNCTVTGSGSRRGAHRRRGEAPSASRCLNHPSTSHQTSCINKMHIFKTNQ